MFVHISCGHVVRDFVCEAKPRCNFQLRYSKTSLILQNFQKCQCECAGPQKQIHKSIHRFNVFLGQKNYKGLLFLLVNKKIFNRQIKLVKHHFLVTSIPKNRPDLQIFSQSTNLGIFCMLLTHFLVTKFNFWTTYNLNTSS